MSLRTVYTTNCTIHCPVCAKSMLLKNWKSHCQQMHNMSQTEVDVKYYEMKKDVEQSKLGTVASHLVTIEKPTPLIKNTLFSMKKFALTKTDNVQGQLVDEGDQINRLESMELDTQDTVLNLTTENIEPALISTDVRSNMNNDGMLLQFFFGRQIVRKQYSSV